MKKHDLKCLLIGILCTFFLSGCSTIVGAAIDTTIAVAKVPFKVGGAVIDMATADKKKKSKRDDERDAENDSISTDDNSIDNSPSNSAENGYEKGYEEGYEQGYKKGYEKASEIKI